MSYLKISAGAIALAVFAGSVTAFAFVDAKNASHDGTVVKITSTELVMKTRDQKEHTHTLSNATTMTLDGEDCTMADLKSGLKIRVTTDAANAKAVTHIEAISSNAMFSHTHEGQSSAALVASS